MIVTMRWLLGIAVLVVSSWWLWWYSSSSDKKGRDGKMSKVPKGRLGWPVIGETLDFISHGYSSQPEAFMMKRRAIEEDMGIFVKYQHESWMNGSSEGRIPFVQQIEYRATLIDRSYSVPTSGVSGICQST